MAGRFILPILALLTSAIPAAAQELGGVRLAPGIKGGPVGLARPLPFTRPPLLTAHDLQNGMTSADHQAQDQDMISRLRGDPGFLSGFSFGTPLAREFASRCPTTVGTAIAAVMVMAKGRSSSTTKGRWP